MHVRVVRVFGELDDVRLVAADNCLNRLRDIPDERAELGRLVVVQRRDGGDVSADYQLRPSLDGAAECVRDVPSRGAEDRIPRWCLPSVAASDQLACHAIAHDRQ